MAPKSNKSLRELMKGRNMTPTPQEANKSKPQVNPPPPPPQLPTDLGLKPNPELRRKRQHKAPEEGEIGLQRETNNRGCPRTKEVGDPTLLKAKKILLWLKCAVHHAYGLLNWKWTMSPLPGIPPLDITTGGMQIMLPRLWSSPSSFQKTWRLTGASINRSSSYSLRRIWPW